MRADRLKAALGPWRYWWYWVRSACFQLSLVVTVLLFAPPILIAPLIPMSSQARWKYSYAIARAWTQTALFSLRWLCGIRHEVHGRAWLPSTPAVVMTKHQSAWETLAQLSILPPQCWVLKRELLAVPFFGWALRSLKPIPVARGKDGAGRSGLQGVIDNGTVRLREGLWVVVFPEGTRVTPGEPKRYRAGGAHLAVSAGVPVVPVAHNAGSHWMSGTVLKIPGTITMSIGPTIDPQGKTAAEVLDAARSWIEQEQKLLDPVEELVQVDVDDSAAA
ncbi:MAG: lysophospholipid acyltransferase family protein [Pseudomonadota bacterium]